ncbi:MAG: MBL fold metallo-hydrolase [Deltaproteobacteria bacterium]|nr:MBL fold metallo-hydrolase [Deltaproteobacteria bacterium]
MRLTVVGSSDAFNSAGRCHSCYWLDGACDGSVMVDFGATALSAARRAGKEPRDLRAIVFTHLHGDHIGGFPYLWLDGMYNNIRTKDLLVVGPIGTRERVVSLGRVAYGDVIDRPRPYDIEWREILPGGSTSFGGLTVNGFAAQHMDPPDQPLCVRIEGADRSVVAFSGDTEVCEGLFQASHGADLLVAECSGMRPPAGRHITWAEWAVELPRVKARKVLLTHLNAEVRSNAPSLVTQKPDHLELGFAEDGLVIDVPPSR